MARDLTYHVVPGVPETIGVTATDPPGPDGCCSHYLIHDATVLPPFVTTTFAPARPAFVPAALVFQSGPLKEAGLNGISCESLMAVCLDRYISYEMGRFPSRYNVDTITHLRAALVAQTARTADRVARGVEGYSKP